MSIKKSDIYRQISLLVEAYAQYDDYIKEADAETRKQNNRSQADRGDALKLLGPKLYSKLEKRGSMETYAPITVESLRLTYDDIAFVMSKWIVGDDLIEKYVQKVVKYVSDQYPTADFKLTLGGMISSTIQCRTFDEVCKFIAVLYKGMVKTVKGIEPYMDWKRVINKLKT